MTLRSKVALILVAAIFAVLAVATLLRAMEQQRSYMVARTQQGITLTQTLAELKAEAKRVPGRTFMMDRRSTG